MRKGEMMMNVAETQLTDLYEEGSNMETREENAKGKPMVLLIFLAFLLLYAPIQFLGAYRMIAGYKLPDGAEMVYKPGVSMFSCCAGDRLAIEEVYRVPIEKAADIEYGKKGNLIVEPWDRDGYTWPENVRVSGSYEHDCSYVYDYYRMWDEVRENDGYFYIHVWGRKYLGSEGSPASMLLCFSVLGIVFLLPALAVFFGVRLVKRILKKRQAV